MCEVKSLGVVFSLVRICKTLNRLDVRKEDSVHSGNIQWLISCVILVEFGFILVAVLIV